MMDNNLCIFYTDDDADDQDLFRDVVTEIDHSLELHIQNDGNELISILDNPPPRPYLIFLDLNMPVRNGIDVLREIKGTEKLKDLPVIIFSTSNDEYAIRTTKELGANFYIEKPTTYNALKKAFIHSLSINWEIFKPVAEDFVYRNN